MKQNLFFRNLPEVNNRKYYVLSALALIMATLYSLTLNEYAGIITLVHCGAVGICTALSLSIPTDDEDGQIQNLRTLYSDSK